MLVKEALSQCKICGFRWGYSIDKLLVIAFRPITFSVLALPSVLLFVPLFYRLMFLVVSYRNNLLSHKYNVNCFSVLLFIPLFWLLKASCSRQALTDDEDWWVREVYPLNSFLFRHTINQVSPLHFHVVGIFAVLRPGNHPIDLLLSGTQELSGFTCLKNCRQC